MSKLNKEQRSRISLMNLKCSAPSAAEQKPAFGYYGDTEPAYLGQKNQAPSAAERNEQSKCNHHWVDYGTLVSGDNPKLKIEICVRCGVQQKKQRSEQPSSAKATEDKQEWTLEFQPKYVILNRHDGTTPVSFPMDYNQTLREITDAHSAELATEGQRTHEAREATVEVSKRLVATHEQLLSALAALKKLMAMDSPDFGRKLIAGEVHDVASKALNL